jgi:hypothetical protein
MVNMAAIAVIDAQEKQRKKKINRFLKKHSLFNRVLFKSNIFILIQKLNDSTFTRQISRKTPTHVIIDCGGVGYQMNISLHTYSLLPNAIL